MPSLDGTGPVWDGGPGVGWGLGPCGAGLGWRRGFGWRFGRGRAFFGMRRAPMSSQEETAVLKEEAEILNAELQAVKKRIAELKKTK